MPSSFDERCRELAEACWQADRLLGQEGYTDGESRAKVRAAARLLEALPEALAIRPEGPGDDLSDHYDGMRAALNGVREALTAAATPPSAGEGE